DTALARYSAERWTHNTALRLSSAATGAAGAEVAARGGAEAHPARVRAASRTAETSGLRMGRASWRGRGGECSEVPVPGRGRTAQSWSGARIEAKPALARSEGRRVGE